MNALLNPHFIEIDITFFKYKNFMSIRFYDEIINVHDTLINDDVKQSKFVLDNHKSNFFNFTLDGKSDDATLFQDNKIIKDTKVIIDKIIIDGIPINLPLIENMCVFSPNLTSNQQKYFNDHPVDLTLNTLSYNGEWSMLSSEHFWQTYNQNEIKSLTNLDEYGLQSHIGMVDEKNLLELSETLQEITKWQKF